ncbi:unnamed protein product [Moneuplotes crassus]|uniref:Uncharacterized protein n=1 Tax=Euplotes crassus TaxID=5936 RepID=A0AAD1UB08_EUPCR|nr:unnamed protein product [Moneuplotes crassus]
MEIEEEIEPRQSFSLLSEAPKKTITLRPTVLEDDEELFNSEDYQYIKRIISFFTASLVLITTVINFVLTASAYQKAVASQNQINYLFDNWNSHYVVDIQSIQDKYSCPKDYKPMVKRAWPGTVEGCNCTATNFTTPTIMRGECTEKQVKADCKDIQPILKMALQKFHNRLICIKREPIDFLETVRPNSKGRCPGLNQRLCGDPDSDFSYHICVKGNQKCPITDIIVTDDSSTINDGKYTQVELDDNKVLLFSKSADFLPVVQFKLTEGSPCITENEYDITKNRYVYKLIDKSTNEGCITPLNDETLYDKRFRFIDGISEYDLFKDNGILDAMKSNENYKGQEYSRDYTFNLYQKSYIRWKLSCEEVGLTRQAIYTKVQNVEQAWWWQSLFKLFCLYNMLITGFIFGVVDWSKNLYDLIKKPASTHPCLEIWGKITHWIVISVSFCKIFFVYVCVSYIDKYEYSIRILQLNKCSDQLTNDIFGELGSSLMSSRPDNLLTLKLTMLMLAFEAIKYLTPSIVDLRKSQGYVHNFRKKDI